jgi:ribosomal protein S18 acetylase RimI-like enzyme
MKPIYFKRYRMELDLRRYRPPAALPPGFEWVPWHDSLLSAHADTKYQCFHQEMDAAVFPCLGYPAGCRELMAAIITRWGFCPQATWLVASPDGYAGTVQGIIDDQGHGGIQNLGVVAEHRGRGVGKTLLLKALDGFAAVGVRRTFLEVTAHNEPAVRMYRDLGFRSYRTVYRQIHPPVPADDAHLEPLGAVGLGL